MGIQCRMDEPVTQFSVRASQLRQKVAAGGGNADDYTVPTAILRGLPEFLR